MIRLNIDGKECSAFPGQTILEVARANDIDIPTLCHDDQVKIYGSCGMCVVEAKGNRRLLRACATEAADGMIIFTNTDRVRQSRKVTLELLLSDHTGDCRPPCHNACPANTDCQGYVGLIANGQYREAVDLIKEKLPLPASLGLVCPHPCEDACRRNLVEEPVSIAALKYFVGNWVLENEDPILPEVKPATGKKVAIVGAGPAGLTAAYFLAIEGHEVTVYDAMPQPGGMVRYGIPEYRLPKDLLDREIAVIAQLGVKFVNNTRVGTDVSLDYLRETHDAVFIAIGAWRSASVNLKGEDTPGVYGGIDFLREVAMNRQVELGDRVAVIGCGNTAIDAVRTAIRLGASEAHVLYRRSREEMPAEEIEVQEAEEEGAIFRFLVSPKEVVAENGRVVGIQLEKMTLGEPDASGRRRPVPTGEEEFMPLDNIIVAIGQGCDPCDMTGVCVTKRDNIAVDPETMMTDLPGVFAGGDCVTGPGIAIEAVAQARKAVDTIHGYLAGQDVRIEEPYLVEQTELTEADFADEPRIARIPTPVLEPQARKDNFRQVTLSMSESEARAEASRCLECGCQDYFECKLINYANLYKAQPGRIEGSKNDQVLKEDHPFMDRDSEKCILCGLCVRTCEEVMGITALGLVNRGFDTIVRPEFDLPLKDTGCVSCGQCIAVCPTGALTERSNTGKNIPLDLDETATVCAFCSLECERIIHKNGDRVIRVVPAEGGNLCIKGKFGFEAYDRERVTKPLVRQEGQLVETTWEDALVYAAKKTQSIKMYNGEESLAVFVSPAYTVEEAQAAAGFGRLALGTDKIATFSRNAARGLNDMLGEGISTNSAAELMGTDLIFAVGSFNESQMAAIKIRQAVKEGVKLIVVSPEDTLVDDVAVLKVNPEDNSTGFLKEILAAVIKNNVVAGAFVETRVEGFAELQASLEGIEPGAEAIEIAKQYAQAKTAMIVVDGNLVKVPGVQLLADLALITGKIGAARNGLVVVTPGSNAAGIQYAGVDLCQMQLKPQLEKGSIKGAFIFGEDPVGSGSIKAEELKDLELLVVSTQFMTPTAELSDVVLPGANPLEVSGTYIRGDGKINQLQQIHKPAAGLDNLEIINRLADAFKTKLSAVAVPEGDHLGAYVKHAETFATEGGKAKLVVPDGGVLFEPAPIQDPATRIFAEKKRELGIK